MIIRTANDDDIPAICSLYHDLFTEMVVQQPANLNTDVLSEAFPKNVIDDENGDIILAVDGDDVIGFMHLQEMTAPTFGPYLLRKYCVIISIGVHPSHRGIGVGAALLNNAKDWSRKRNLDYVQLELLAESTETFHIYEKEGFQTVMYTMRYALK